MKELITGIAMLLLMCVFMLQFTTNQIIHNKLVIAESDINIFVEEIKEDGCVQTGEDSPANKLKESLIADLKIENTDKVTITGTSEVKRRGEIVDYEITYPIEGVIGANKFFGVGDEDNVVIRKRVGSTASEYLDSGSMFDDSVAE